MLGENHSIMFEFPEFKQEIVRLKQVDQDFANMMRDYHDVDHTIRGLEVNGIPTTDERINHLRLKRVGLKDKLFNRLTNGIK